MIELKYCKKNAPDSEVQRKTEDAKIQLQKYLTDHRIEEKCNTRKWLLHTAVVVFRGWKLEVLDVN